MNKKKYVKLCKQEKKIIKRNTSWFYNKQYFQPNYKNRWLSSILVILAVILENAYGQGLTKFCEMLW